MDRNKQLSNLLNGVIVFRENHPRNAAIEKSISFNQKEILTALNEFMECVRYLNTRRTTTTVLSLESEDDVQDALYLMLRPWIKDLQYEDPSNKSASRFVIRDFFVPSAKMIIEAKFVRDRKHGKDISKELHDDIEMYKSIDACSVIVFFIYDPNGLIPSHENLRSSICVPRSYGSKQISVELIIKP